MGMLAVAAKRFVRSLAVISDEELIAEVLGGRTAAFAELASRYRDKVDRLCQRFFADREMVRDLAQESFIRAFAALSTFRAEMPFVGGLRAIVVNVCYVEVRLKHRRPYQLAAAFNRPPPIQTHPVHQPTPPPSR